MTAATLSLEVLIEASPALEKALRGAARAAASTSPILIQGEPGTGRSTLARALHGASARHSGPLLEMDVGLIPGALFESELFGHRPGAFTGAETAAEGRLGLASAGSLVLDHVEELPATVQPKLLRLLAEGRYSPLGGRERRADVRFLAIGSPDLARRVEAGAFRSDLYYRLDVLHFQLPPLHQRREDLPAIIATLLADLAGRMGRPVPRLSPVSERWMVSYAWPGNLRQLRNLLERAMVLAEGKVLDIPPPEDSRAHRPLSLAEVETRQIRLALAHARGHQGRAAEILGISRKALWQKRKRFGIP